MKKTIFALGFFDGVHLGHQALLAKCQEMAAQNGCVPAAITFDRHPQSLFLPDPPPLINHNGDRELLLRHYGIRHILELPVREDVMSTSWQDFLNRLICDGAEGFVCGDDFRFGHKGEGDAQKLQQFCAQRDLPCVIVPEQTMDGVRISSTHIRGLIESADVETAAKFLGHPHILSGEVVSGRQLGRTIGVPTANILIPLGVALPKFGVYACKASIDGREYPAVTNIGSRPTVGGHQVRSESWILDFDGDLYNSRIVLKFHKFLRPEEKFSNLEKLKQQIQCDAAQANMLLR